MKCIICSSFPVQHLSLARSARSRASRAVPRQARAEVISWGGKDPLCAHVGYCFKGNFMFAINLSR